MHVTVKIHGTAFKPLSPREVTVDVEQGSTFNDLIQKLGSSFEPAIRQAIIDGTIWKAAAIFLNSININYLKGPNTQLEEKCILAIIPAVVGV